MKDNRETATRHRIIGFPVNSHTAISAGRPLVQPPVQGSTTNRGDFVIPMGEGWSDTALTLRFTMPAVDPRDCRLSTKARRLHLSGLRRRPEFFGDADRTFFGIPYGRFEQTVVLPDVVDLDRLMVVFHHGVLDVRIPFREDAWPPAMQVTSAGQVRRS